MANKTKENIKSCRSCKYLEIANSNEECCMYICYTGHRRESVPFKGDDGTICDKYVYDEGKKKSFKVITFGRERKLSPEDREKVRQNRKKEKILGNSWKRNSNGYISE